MRIIRKNQGRMNQEDHREQGSMRITGTGPFRRITGTGSIRRITGNKDQSGGSQGPDQSGSRRTDNSE